MKKSKLPDMFKGRFHKAVQNILWGDVLAKKLTGMFSEVLSTCDINDFISMVSSCWFIWDEFLII